MPSYDSFHKATSSTKTAIVIVRTTKTLRKLLTIAAKASMIYLELIGHNQIAYSNDRRARLAHKRMHRGWESRGPLALVVLRAFPHPDIFVVDIDELGGHNAMTCRTLAQRNNSLEALLENPRIPKVVWDIFDPVDMLWTQYGIRLQNGLDLQLVENAARKTSKLYLNSGIEAALKADLRLPKVELDYNTKCRRTLEERFLVADELEPLNRDGVLLQYCANCVRYMPQLFFKYMDKTEGEWLTKAHAESARRIVVALNRGCDLRSPTKAMGPWGSGEPFKYKNYR